MRTLMLWMMGWRVFTFAGVTVCQRNRAIDQTAIVSALEASKSRRTWCKDSHLTLYVEDGPFVGYYGSTATGEVLRYSRFGRRATVRVSAARLYHESLVEMLWELGRDN